MYLNMGLPSALAPADAAGLAAGCAVEFVVGLGTLLGEQSFRPGRIRWSTRCEREVKTAGWVDRLASQWAIPFGSW